MELRGPQRIREIGRAFQEQTLRCQVLLESKVKDDLITKAHASSKSAVSQLQKYTSSKAEKEEKLLKSAIESYSRSILDLTYYQEQLETDADFTAKSSLDTISLIIHTLSLPALVCKDVPGGVEAVLGQEILECLYWRVGALLYMYCYAVFTKEERRRKMDASKFLKCCSAGVCHLQQMLSVRTPLGKDDSYVANDSNVVELLRQGVFSDIHMLSLMYSGDMCYWAWVVTVQNSSPQPHPPTKDNEAAVTLDSVDRKNRPLKQSSETQSGDGMDKKTELSLSDCHIANPTDNPATTPTASPPATSAATLPWCPSGMATPTIGAATPPECPSTVGMATSTTSAALSPGCRPLHAAMPPVCHPTSATTHPLPHSAPYIATPPAHHIVIPSTSSNRCLSTSELLSSPPIPSCPWPSSASSAGLTPPKHQSASSPSPPIPSCPWPSSVSSSDPSPPKQRPDPISGSLHSAPGSTDFASSDSAVIKVADSIQQEPLGHFSPDNAEWDASDLPRDVPLADGAGATVARCSRDVTQSLGEGTSADSCSRDSGVARLPSGEEFSRCGAVQLSFDLYPVLCHSQGEGAVSEWLRRFNPLEYGLKVLSKYINVARGPLKGTGWDYSRAVKLMLDMKRGCVTVGK